MVATDYSGCTHYSPVRQIARTTTCRSHDEYGQRREVGPAVGGEEEREKSHRSIAPRLVSSILPSVGSLVRLTAAQNGTKYVLRRSL